MGLRQIRNEAGVTAVIVAIVVVVLFGFTALAVDVARMYEERRELQRTADLSALSAAQRLEEWEVAGPDREALAEQMGQCYLGENPLNTACSAGNPTTYHPGPYDPGDGDVVDAYVYGNDALAVPPTKCVIETVIYDCVYAKAVAPARSADNPEGFEFSFARVLGFDQRPISADAWAILGAGAPGGEKLVPWALRDCPRQELADTAQENIDYPEYIGENDPAVVEYSKQYGCFANDPNIGYSFSADYANGPFTDLLLGTGEEGNFQGADFAADGPDCPPQTGYFPRFEGAGAADYKAFLSLEKTPCNIWVGARVHPKTGPVPGPTDQGLEDRGIASCIQDEAEFLNAVNVTDVEDGEVSINYTNPCMVAVVLTVRSQWCPDDSRPPTLTTTGEAGAGGTPLAMQADIREALQRPSCNAAGLSDEDLLNAGRFGPLDNGNCCPVVVRRVALFYLVDTPGGDDGYDDPLPDNEESFKGLFLRTLDSFGSDLAPGRCDEESSICVAQLIP